MDSARVPRLSLDLLRGFRAAARHLSFSHAARELFVTQSAVSQQVKALEEQLGTALFRRVNRALQLTEPGVQPYRAVDEALALIDAAAQRIVHPSRTLSVTTTVALASTWLVPRLPRLARAHPEIDLRVVATNDAIDLSRERIDLALRFATLQMPEPSGTKLFDYLQFPVCSPELARSRGRPLRSVDDLSRHVLIDFETVLCARAWYDWQAWSRAMRLRNLRGAGWMRLSHDDQVIEAARRGAGVAIGNWPHVTDDLREGRLVAPLGEGGVAVVGAFFAHIETSAEKDAAEAFVRWVRAEAATAGAEARPLLHAPRRRRTERARGRRRAEAPAAKATAC